MRVKNGEGSLRRKVQRYMSETVHSVCGAMGSALVALCVVFTCCSAKATFVNSWSDGKLTWNLSSSPLSTARFGGDYEDIKAGRATINITGVKYSNASDIANLIIPTVVNWKTGSSIPPTVRTHKINSGAFKDCTALRTITIPGTVTPSNVMGPGIHVIGQPCFRGCSNLTSIKYDVSDNYYNSSNTLGIPYRTKDGILYDGAMTILKKYPEGKIASEYTVPSTVKELTEYCLSNTKLTTIYFQGNAPTANGTTFFTGSEGLMAICYPQGATGWTNPWKGISTYAVPKAVTGLSATQGTSEDGVTISWSPNSIATSYLVYRSTSSTGNKVLLATTSGSTFYVDTYAEAGTKYFYSVVAKNGNYSGAFSSAVQGWKKEKTYAVNYEPGAKGQGSPQTDMKTQNVALTLKGAIFTCTGYAQTGWATRDGGTKVYELGALYSANSAVTFYPFWTANTYIVTLDQQRGSGGTTSVSAEFGTALPTITVPSRQGYVFSGYYTSANGGGTQYYTATGAGTRLWDKTSATTLYANWDPILETYVITYAAGAAGVGAQQTATKTDGVALKLAGAMFTRIGYTQTGWATSDGGAKVYDLEGLYSVDAAAVLYPFWTANTYAVTLDKQNGNGGASSVTATYGSAMPTITVPSLSGYSFGGYFASAGGNGAQYYTPSGESARNWDKAETTTLYAKWTRLYSITYRPGANGTGSQQSAAKSKGVVLALSGAIFSRTGYTQAGWATSDGGAKVYDLGELYMEDADMTLYPAWTANSYVVTLDLQDGSGGSVDVTVTYGKAMPPIDVPTRIGYTFGGYYTLADGLGRQYYHESGDGACVWDVAGDETLYAKWVANGGGGEPDPVYVQVPEEYGTYNDGTYTWVWRYVDDGAALEGFFRYNDPDDYSQGGDWARGVYPEPVGSVTIPATVNCLPVVELGYSLFMDCKGLTKVVIPDTVERIDGAFVGAGLRSVNLPASVRFLGSDTFYNTPLEEINVPENLEQVSGWAFLNTPWLAAQGEWAFFGDGNLVAYQGTASSVVVPDTVKVICEAAFYGGDLEAVYIPASVEEIGDYAFAYCESLETVVFGGDMWDVRMDIEEAFRETPWLANLGVDPPSNDGFGDAEGLSGSSGNVSSSNFGATAEEDDPLNVRWGSTASVWWKWTAPANGTVSFNTSGSSFDTVLGIYTGTSILSLTAVAENDDAEDACDYTSLLTFDAVAGRSYYVAVGGYQSDAGQIVLRWSLETSPCGGVPAPDGLTAEGTREAIALSWNAVVGADFYEVWRGTTDDTASATQLVAVVETSYSDAATTAGVTYRYWLRAVCGESASDFSDCVTAYRYPRSVSELHAESGVSGVLISWVASPDATSYYVYRRDAADGANSCMVGRTEATCLIDTNAVAGVEYLYWVGAYVQDAEGVMGGFMSSSDAVVGKWTGPGGEPTYGTPTFTVEDGILTAVELNGATSVTTPSGITAIGNGVFEDLDTLESVTVSKGVTSIGEGAFSGCSALARVDIPASVTMIDPWAFDYCSSLVKITVAKDNPSFKSVNGMLLTKDGKTILQGVNGKVVVPPGVEVIGDSAFYGLSGLTGVTMPASVGMLDEYAFGECDGLTRLTIPAGVTNVAYYALGGCSRLVAIDVAAGNTVYCAKNGLLLAEDGAVLVQGVNGNVTIPSGVVYIGEEAFDSLDGLTGVTIPDSVTDIGYGAFRYCAALSDLTIPDSVTYIAAEAFYGCSALTRVTIPASVDSVGYHAFAYDYELAEANVPRHLEEYVDDSEVFYGGSDDLQIDYYDYIVRFHKNDASNDAAAEQLMDAGTATRLTSLNSLGWAKRGLDFVGWGKYPNSTVVWKSNWANVTDLADSGETVDLYAMWAVKPGGYAIEFVRNDGAGTWRTVGFNYGEKTRIPSVAKGLGWARRGYDFKGWALTTADANAGKVWKGDWAYVATPVKAGEVLTVYAVWALKPGYYQIRFNKNDGSGRWRTLGFECDKSTKLSTIAGLGWERPGCTFKGWASNKANADAGKVWKPDGEWVTNATAEGRTLSIYAIWE